MIIQPLVGRSAVEGAEGLDVGAGFDEVEDVVKNILDLVAAAVDSEFDAGVGVPDVTGQLQKRVAVATLAEEQEAVDSEVVGDELVDFGRGELLPDVLLEEGGVAPGAITPAVGDFHCQGNAVGYLFCDGVRQLGDEFKHPSPWGCRSACRPQSDEARRRMRYASGSR